MRRLMSSAVREVCGVRDRFYSVYLPGGFALLRCARLYVVQGLVEDVQEWRYRLESVAVNPLR